MFRFLVGSLIAMGITAVLVVAVVVGALALAACGLSFILPAALVVAAVAFGLWAAVGVASEALVIFRTITRRAC
jgi:hypothetical protein